MKIDELISLMEKRLTITDKSSEEYSELVKAIGSFKDENEKAAKLLADREATVKKLGDENASLSKQINDAATKIVSLENTVTSHTTELAVQRERARQSRSMPTLIV